MGIDAVVAGRRVGVAPALAVAGLTMLVWIGLTLWLPGAGGRTRPRCLGCGYDPTGNTSGACPECGCGID